MSDWELYRIVKQLEAIKKESDMLNKQYENFINAMSPQTRNFGFLEKTEFTGAMKMLCFNLCEGDIEIVNTYFYESHDYKDFDSFMKGDLTTLPAQE